MTNHALKHIVIVGGGSAGWLTAGVIAAEHHARMETGVQVTLLESPDVAPLGVGEGTWPTMRDTLSRIGVSETAFFRDCDASFKQGSRFNGWVDGSADDHYFHPFVLPQGYGEVNLPEQWQLRQEQLKRRAAQTSDDPRRAGVTFADLVSFQPHLCVRGKAPKQFTTPEFAAVANYGYHLDAGKFGVFLQKHCTEQLGVRHVLDHMTAIHSHENGDIASLQTKDHGAIAADLFIDCTGSRSLLLGQHYGVALLPQDHILFNNSALAVQVPYPDERTPIASQTLSTAQENGWIWDIGLPTRRGTGHVYSSAHTSDDAAEQALRDYIVQTGGPKDIPTPRKLSFQPGYRERFWHRNCVAIGQSAGFIEPLEASALAMVELSAAMLADGLPATRASMDAAARRFNETFSYRWARVIDFLKLHYVLTRRTGSAYWRDNCQPETIPERLREQLALWREVPPSRYDLHRIEEVFPSASYQYVLYGMGFETAYGARSNASNDAGRAEGYFREAANLTGKMLGALPNNREMIDHIVRHGMHRV